MKTYEPMAGERIDDAAAAMVELANFTNEPVTATFNEIPLNTAPGGDAAAIVSGYHTETQRRHDEYVASPEYAKRQRESAEAAERHAKALREALSAAPATLTLRNAEDWQKSVDANKDGGYGEAVMVFAEQWARIMESRIAAGESLEACANDAVSLADDQGITGFQYGCAVSILSQTWIHGEQLRRWHNVKTQIRDEGERANESGGVLNPALLSVGG